MAAVSTSSLNLRDGVRVTVELERPAAGRLGRAYPAGAHDLEVRITGAQRPESLTEALIAVVREVQAADPRCKRVVYAAAADDPVRAAAARAAGFRPVVEVELPGGRELNLLVAEPAWVTRVDMDLDRVPGT
ncbi:hypothetical protein ABGB12_20710 [Actinocorallia sp. B10E7]|uniref:hypothetical protein n=1 Tax=Actinocorallia sp. B10E7 TaxID=3153558 RepID=UPI00325CCBFC